MGFFDFFKQWKISREDEGFPPLPERQEDPAAVWERFEAVRTSVLPQLAAAPADSALEIVQADLLRTLSLRYIVSQNGGTQPLREEQVPKDMEEAELRALAVENLLREQTFAVRATKFGAYGLQGDPKFTSAFLLVNEVWHRLAEKLGEDLILAVPTSEIILFAPISQMDAIARMGQASRDLHSHSSVPLTLKLFCYRKETQTLELWDL